MTWLFWGSLALVAYTYFGYPALLWACNRLRTKPIRRGPVDATVSVVMAVHNEARALPKKLRNLSEIAHGDRYYEVVIVSDGSTDETAAILGSWSDPRFRMILSTQQQGKACALNQGIATAHGDIVVFTDARQFIEPEAVESLLANFADSTVGCVSGELMFGDFESHRGTGLSLYWSLEKAIRRMESNVGSVVGATGSLYAVRRELLTEMPPGTLLDDVYLPMQVVLRGKRVVFEPEARAWDAVVTEPGVEYRRKVRTMTGNYQLMQQLPWLLTARNPVWFQFVSHKLLRLLVPFGLILLLLSSAALPGWFYRAALGAQIVCYLLALLGVAHVRAGVLSRVANLCLTFVMLNMAAVAGFINFVTGKKAVWVRAAAAH